MIDKTVNRYLKEFHLEKYDMSNEVEEMLLWFSHKFKLWDKNDVESLRKKLTTLDRDTRFWLERKADEFGNGNLENAELKDTAKELKRLFIEYNIGRK